MSENIPPFQLDGFVVRQGYSNLGFARVIDDIISGDDYFTERVFTLPVDLLDLKDYPVKIYFTVKADPRDSDSNAAIHLTITSVDSGNGYIKTDFSSVWLPMTDFTLKISGTLTGALVPEQPYYYDIKYITHLNGARTYERGRLFAQQGVTRAIS